MTHLKELVKEYCPEGVDYILFPEVCEYIRGITYNKAQEVTENSEGCYRVLRANNITLSSNTLNFDDVKYVSSKVRVKDAQFLRSGDILMCASSGSQSHVGKVAYIGNDIDYTFGGFMAVIRCSNAVDSKYMFYILSSGIFADHLKATLKSNTIKTINSDVMNTFRFPLPPMIVQEEIVKTLDIYIDNCRGLISELEKEKTLRGKQYSALLNRFFERNDVEHLPISTLGSLKRGKRFVHADAVEDGIPCVHYGELYTYYGTFATKTNSFIRRELAPDMRYAYPGDVIIVGAGENNTDIGIGLSWEGDSGVAVHDACYTFTHSQNSRYISYYLRSKYYHEQIKRYVSEGKICSISAEGIGAALVPVPSLVEQERIALVLEKLESATREIQKALTTEIEKRMVQYRYYLDELLSFQHIHKGGIL